MMREELEKIEMKHRLWLNGEEGGERADLRYMELRDSDLSELCLKRADLSCSDLRLAYLFDSDLTEANLRAASMQGADLRGACLVGANIDESAWPLGCGSKGVKVDLRIVYQLLGITGFNVY